MRVKRELLIEKYRPPFVAAGSISFSDALITEAYNIIIL